MLLVLPSCPYAQVRCWSTANGEAQTTVCDNGFWLTTLPDGTQVSGNGMSDPNAKINGSAIVLDKPGRVIPPETPSGAQPGSWFLYGAPVP